MHKRTSLIWGLLVLCLSVSVQDTAADDCETKIVPEGAGEKTCTYRNIPFGTVSYQGTTLTATWSDDYEIDEAYILADFTVLGAYTEGLAISLEKQNRVRRYDLALRVHDNVTNEDYLAVSRLFCKVNGSFVNAWEVDCQENTTQDCSVTSSTTCADGTVVSVSCSGDTGTCSDACGSSTQACCKSTETTTVVHPNGTTVVHTTVTTVTQQCPPNPGQ